MISEELAAFRPLAQAIARLLHPYAEIVLHDLKKQRIAAIYNNFSRRNVGDDCLIDDEANLDELPEFFPPYYKLNWDGRKLKSISITIRDATKKAIGLFCINLDISFLEEWRDAIEQFIHLKPPSIVPQNFFHENWRERVNAAITEFLTERQLTVESLSPKQKRELMHLLEEKGLMHGKRVADYVQGILL